MTKREKERFARRVQKAVKETGCNQGFFCRCGKAHGFSLYVLAHWTADLRMTCEDCGREWSVTEGSASNAESDSCADGWDVT